MKHLDISHIHDKKANLSPMVSFRRARKINSSLVRPNGTLPKKQVTSSNVRRINVRCALMLMMQMLLVALTEHTNKN